jgi:hypothetical protein
MSVDGVLPGLEGVWLWLEGVWSGLAFKGIPSERRRCTSALIRAIAAFKAAASSFVGTLIYCKDL